jgi:hypothetical protein
MVTRLLRRLTRFRARPIAESINAPRAWRPFRTIGRQRAIPDNGTATRMSITAGAQNPLRPLPPRALRTKRLRAMKPTAKKHTRHFALKTRPSLRIAAI